MNTNKGLLLLVIVAMLVGFLGVVVDPVKATPKFETQQPACVGLDLVLLVSQSGWTQINDPQFVRREAILKAFDILGDNILFFCPGYRHRIAVVSFGDRSSVRDVVGVDGRITAEDWQLDVIQHIPSQFSTISPDLQNRSAWDIQKDALAKKIPYRDELFKIEIEFGRSKLMATLGENSNHVSGFEAAASVFADWNTEWKTKYPGEENRQRKAVVVVSEGAPCSNLDGCVYPFTKGFDRIKSVVDTKLPFRGADGKDSVFIYMVGLNSQEGATNWIERPEVKKFWEELTARHGGSLQSIDRKSDDKDQKFLNSEITSKIATVLFQLSGSEVEALGCNEPLWIDPYQYNLSILHFFVLRAEQSYALSDVRLTISIYQGDKVAALIEGGKVIQGNLKIVDWTPPPNERYVLLTPPPGKVKIDTHGTANLCNDINARVEKRSIVVKPIDPEPGKKLQEIDAKPFFNRTNPDVFRFNLFQLDQNGAQTPLQEFDGFNLDLKVSVRSLDIDPEVSYTYDVIPIDKNGTYQTADRVTKEPFSIIRKSYGQYEWVLTGTTKNPQNFEKPGNPAIEIVREKGAFTITPLLRKTSIKITNLIPGPNGAPVEIPVVDGLTQDVVKAHARIEGLREDLSFASGNKSPLRALLTTDKGVVVSEALLQKVGVNEFEADLPSGKSNVKSYDPGCYQVKLELTGDYDKLIVTPPEKIEHANICMIKAEKFTWRINSPQPEEVFTLHSMLGLGLLVKSPVEIQLVPNDATIKPPYDINKMGKDVLTGKVFYPGDNTPRPIAFTPVDGAEKFVAQWPADANREGPYRFEICVEKDNIGRWLVVGDPCKTVNVSMQDNWLTKSWSWMASIALALILIIFVILMISATGWLYGCVLKFDTYDGNSQGDLVVSGQWNRKKYTARKKQISQEIPQKLYDKVIVTGQKPQMNPAARAAANVEIIYQDENIAPLSLSIEEGDHVMVESDEYLTLEKRQGGSIGLYLKQILLTVLMLGIWAGVCAALYFNWINLF